METQILSAFTRLRCTKGSRTNKDSVHLFLSLYRQQLAVYKA